MALVLTDCVGAAWRTGLAQRLLARWGAKASVAIVQPLPRLLWPRTGANPRQMLLSSRTAGTPNVHVHASEPMLPLPALRAGQIPVPVLELTGAPLTEWAALVANGGSTALPVLAVSGADADPAAAAASPQDEEPRPRDSVSTFRSAVSPQAYRLAGHLAAVEPLTLPVMRVVQRAVLPDSHPGYLAEVFLGGVLERIDARDPRWDRYRLRPGIGELLLDTLSTRDGMRTIDAVSAHFERSATSGAKLPILLRNPEGSATLPDNLAPLARVGSALLRHLGLLPAEPADTEPTETPSLPTPPEPEEETEGILRARIDYLRERAEEDEQSLRALARNTYRLGILLKEEERKEEARDALEAATHMFRRLTTDSRSDSRSDVADLARSLYQAGVVLWRLGQYESALDRDREAVSLWRPLVAADPDTYEGELADSLNGTGVDLSKLGRHEEALVLYREAVEIRRRLAAVDPEKYEADLAKSVHNVGFDLSELGRHEEALIAKREAVEIRRRLAAVDPGKYEADLAKSLHDVGVDLSELGRHEEVLAVDREAVEILRRLAAVDPGRYEADLADSLERLGLELHELRRYGEDLVAVGEAAEIWGRLATVDPEKQGDLARSLHNVGVSLQRLDRWNESLDMMSRAVAAYEQATRTDRRRKISVELAKSLYGQSHAFAALGRREEALAAVDLAIGVVDELDDRTDEDSHFLDALRNLKTETESAG